MDPFKTGVHQKNVLNSTFWIRKYPYNSPHFSRDDIN